MINEETVVTLGGGGARGLAHLGVLAVLQGAGVPIHRVIGVSIGSIAGALFAFGADIEEVQQRVVGYLESPAFQVHQTAMYGAKRRDEDDPEETATGWFTRVRKYLRANRVFHRVIMRPSLLPGRVLDDAIDALLPDADISDALRPFSVVAVDLRSGRRVVIERGSLRKAVRGSSSLPGIFPPVEMDGKLLADIGVIMSLPTEVARQYEPRHVIAVDVTPDLPFIEDFDSALDIMLRMEDIAGQMFRRRMAQIADVVIRPDVGHLEWMDFSSVRKVIALGRDAARRALPSIKEQLGLTKDAAPSARRD